MEQTSDIRRCGDAVFEEARVGRVEETPAQLLAHEDDARAR
jgi:hypothetical protein